MPTSTRLYSGFFIRGTHQGLDLHATLRGLIRVSVTGWDLYPDAESLRDRGVRFGGEGVPSSFKPDEIQLTEAGLTCLARADWYLKQGKSFYREGFAVDLEDGMAEAVRAGLERVVPLAAHMLVVRERLEALLAKTEKTVDGFNYCHGLAEETLARVALDGEDLHKAADSAFSDFAQKDGGLSSEVAYFKVQFLVAAQQVGLSGPIA